MCSVFLLHLEQYFLSKRVNDEDIESYVQSMCRKGFNSQEEIAIHCTKWLQDIIIK